VITSINKYYKFYVFGLLIAAAFLYKTHFPSQANALDLDECLASSCTYDVTECCNCGGGCKLVGYCRGGCSYDGKDPTGGGGGSIHCNVGSNVSCEEMADYVGCDGSNCSKVFFKELFTNPNPASSTLVDTNVMEEGEKLAMDLNFDAGEELTGIQAGKLTGFSDNFLDLPKETNYGGTPYCSPKEIRNYANIYIPQGWYSFGILGNRTGLTPGSFACYYCPEGARYCAGDNYQYYWDVQYCSGGGSLNHCDTPILTNHYSCDSPNRPEICKPTCGGGFDTWLAETGSGTLDSPLAPPTEDPTSTTSAERIASYGTDWNELVKFDTNEIATKIPEIGGTCSKDEVLVPYSSLNWVLGPGYDPNYGYAQADISFPSASTKNGMELTSTSTYHYSYHPKQIDIYCGEQLLSSKYYGELTSDPDDMAHAPKTKKLYVPLNTTCQNLSVRVFNNKRSWWEVTDYRPVQISDVKFYGTTQTDAPADSTVSTVLFSAYGTDNPGISNNPGYPVARLYVGDEVKKTYYIGKSAAGTFSSYSYRSATKVNPQDVRLEFCNAADWVSLTVDYMALDGVTYQTEDPATYVKYEGGAGYLETNTLSTNGYFWYELGNNPIDRIWTDPQYYSAGWYPIQTAGKSGSAFQDGPKFKWRQYDPQAGTYSGEAIYSNNVGSAKVNSCNAGDISCQTSLSGGSIPENSTVTLNIGTISNYSGAVTVTSADDTILHVDSSSVDSGTGQISVTFTTGSVEDAIVPVTVTVQAAGSSQDVEPCNDLVAFNVVPVGGFWQVENANVTTTGRLSSLLPSNAFAFNNLVGGTSGFPGVNVFSPNAGYSFFNGLISGNSPDMDWVAGSTINSSYTRTNYNFFESEIPSEVSSNESFATNETSVSGGVFGGVPLGGYTWQKFNGNLSIDTASVIITTGVKRVIFVAGDLTIASNISIDSGGFIMFVVSGSINVDSVVNSLEGIYFAGGQFSTGTNDSDNDTPLSIRGSVVAFDGVNLDRDLPDGAGGDLDTPSEYFTYAPDLLLNIPYDFGIRLLKWKEVAPSNL